jgi:tetratricopeptide (TPR) repeat protein
VSKLEQQRWNEALLAGQAAERLSSQYAELQFRLGQCYLALTNREAARIRFERARDLDALPFRADSRINTMIHDAAKRQAGLGVIYLDAIDVLSQESPGDILGDDFFYDHVHLNFAGNYRLARSFADQIASHPTARLGNPPTQAWASPAVCAERLGLTDWNRYPVIDEVLRRLSDAPFTNQANHSVRFRRLVGQLVAVKNRLQPSAWAQARGIYEEAIQHHPEDPWLHQNYAEFLRAVGDLSSGTAQMLKVRALLPHYCLTYLQLGRFLARQEKYAEARQALEQALRLRPDLAEAFLELSQIDASQGKWDEALKPLAAAQRLRPDEAMVYLRRADILAAQQKRPEAIANLREAIRLRPSNWEARYRLGVELATDGKTIEAQAEFEEVVRLRPDYVLGHLNLGVMLARQDRFDEAQARFQETLRLDPRNENARQFIQDLNQSANRR